MRLDVICRKYAYGDENLALKLFDETFKRVLDGRRVLPREEKFIAFLGGVIKSISRELRTSAGRDASSVTVLDVDLSEGKKVHEIAEDDSTLHGSLVERELIAKETLDELENTFADDESALTVLMGIADNMPRKEIDLAFPGEVPTELICFTVTYSYPNGRGGSLVEGGRSIPVREGLAVNVTKTDKS